MRVLVLALSLAALPLAPASAGARCPLVTDPRGDTSVSPYDGGSTPADGSAYRPGDDLLSADVWADAKQAHAVFRLAGLPGDPEDTAPEAQGYWWAATMRQGSMEVTLDVMERSGHFYGYAGWGEVHGSTEDGTGASAVTYTEALGSRASVDRRRHAVRVDVPLSAFGAQAGFVPGSTWRVVGIWADALTGEPQPEPPVTFVYYAGASGVGSTRDVASTPRTVVVGRPDCRG